MPSSFVRTNRPGIYRRGNSYYATVTVNGVTRKVRAGPKQKDAERLKTRLEADRNKGVDITALRERERFADYARSWIASYSGRGRDHVSERTRTEYARDLERHVIPWMQETAIGYIRPQTIDDLIAHLQNDTDLADATIKRVLAPVKACLGDAYRRGDIATNPALGVRVRSRRKVVESDEEQAKALTRVELAALIEAVDPRWRPSSSCWPAPACGSAKRSPCAGRTSTSATGRR